MPSFLRYGNRLRKSARCATGVMVQWIRCVFRRNPWSKCIPENYLGVLRRKKRLIHHTITPAAFILILASIFFGCHRNTSLPADDIMTVEPASSKSVLYFDGNIQPIRTYPIISSIDGVVEKRFFFPGTAVAKNQLLLIISSSKMRDTYRDALVAYIKATRDYNNSQVEMQGVEVLKKYGIISNDEYLATKAKNQDVNFERQQTLAKVSNIMQALRIPLSTLQKINLNEVQTINTILPQSIPSIKIFSPVTGVAIVTHAKSDNQNGNSSETDDVTSLNAGSVIKVDQVLLSIGDMSGITIPIYVDEVHISDIQEGQSVSVSGDAFPRFTLEGKVHIEKRQSSSTPGGYLVAGTATYAVYVNVSHLTKAQESTLRIGMSATVKVPIIKSSTTLSIPITAVYNKGEESFVRRINSTTQQPEDVLVKVGTTSLNTIEILEGLKPGDRILIHAANH